MRTPYGKSSTDAPRFRSSEKKSQKFKFSSNPHFCQSHAARYVDPFTPSIDMIEA